MSDPTPPSRRDFLRRSTAVGLGAGLGSALTLGGPLASAVFAQGAGDVYRVGVIGCGGRGTGAAMNVVDADPSARVVALADLWPDRLAGCKETLAKRFGDDWQLDEDHQFVGWDAYKRLLASDVDGVVLATPPYFRPFHFAAAVAAGKHAFLEKPVAVDPAGLRQVLEAGRRAKEQNLAVVAGTQRRHDPNYVAAIQCLRDGEIGDVTGAAVSWCMGGLWHRGREPEWSELEYQLRNWLYFSWLSGDQICEQHVHNLDVAMWAFGDERPTSAYSSGGRTVRTDAIYGNIYDHNDTTLTMPGGAKVFSKSRQWPGAKSSDIGEEIVGTKGRLVLDYRVCRVLDAKGEEVRRFDARTAPYLLEHRNMIASIREGRPLNETEAIVGSNLAAVMGRESAYSGSLVKGDWMMNESTLRLGPDDCDVLAFGPMEVAPVAVPGEYELV